MLHFSTFWLYYPGISTCYCARTKLALNNVSVRDQSSNQKVLNERFGRLSNCLLTTDLLLAYI